MKKSIDKVLKGSNSQAVHCGQQQQEAEHSLTTPIYMTSTYVFNDTQMVIDYKGGSIKHPEYGRYNNPTQRRAEAKIAALEGADDALLFGSGMAAIAGTLLALLKSGDHMILTHDCYQGIRVLVTQHLERFGITHTIVRTGDWEGLEAAITPKTRLIFSETPTNPYLNVVDLEKLCSVARKHRIKTAIDSTFATPLNTRPHSYGIDLVLHSCTKYLAGHNDVLAGVVTGKAGFIDVIREFQGVAGAVVGPMEAWLLLRGMKTLGLRVRQSNDSALAIAKWLIQQPQVEQVYYPLLPSHPNYDIARKQMNGGGGVVSFIVRGGLAPARKVGDQLQIPVFAPSLGGVESLYSIPSIHTYGGMTPEERDALGIDDGLVRYSVGIEDSADLIADLQQALAALND